MQVFITRPLPAQKSTAAKIKKLGYEPVLLPLQIIAPHKAPRPKTSDSAVLAATSANAFRFITWHKHFSAADFKRPLYVVGDTTAKAAQLAGFKKIINAKGDALALADLLVAAKVTDVLHLCAADTPSALATALSKRTLRYKAWPVYEARPLQKPLAHMAAPKGAYAIMFYAASAARLWQSAQKKIRWPKAALALCLSPAVAKVFTPDFAAKAFASMICAKQPNETALLRLLPQKDPKKAPPHGRK